jgi:hypothetical protein
MGDGLDEYNPSTYKSKLMLILKMQRLTLDFFQ